MSFEPEISDWPFTEPLGRWTYESTPSMGFGYEKNSNAKRINTVIWFRREPRKRGYIRILEFAHNICFAFSLVHMFGEPQIDSVIAELAPWCLLERKTDKWPCNLLVPGEKASIRWFKITTESIRILGKAEGLYTWSMPHYPDDLTFFTADGHGWLGSVGHEKMGWLDLATTPHEHKSDVLQMLRQERIV